MNNILQKALTLSYFLSCLINYTSAQELKKLELINAYNLAEKNYPLIVNDQLLQSVTALNLEIIAKERLPSITGNFEGRIQSDNVSIGTGDPNSPLNLEVPLESHNAYVDINFNLYDGGVTAAEKRIEQANLKVNQQQLKVNLRAIKDRINVLFFSIMLSRQQKVLLKTSIEDIEANIQTLQAGYDNGTVLESELSKLKVRKLELQSDELRLDGDIKAYFSVLEHLVGTPLNTNTELTLPPFSESMIDGNISRPEQDLYDFEKELLTSQVGIINASRNPKISIFAQGGFGYPNPLNFSDIATSTFALGGVRINWKIIDWNKANKEREKLDILLQQIQVKKQTFEFDIASREDEYRQKIAALIQQLENDRKIVTLQQDILKQTETQLNNGIINSNDYLIQVNAELSARLQLELHTVQLQQLQIDYLTLFGIL
ncbi:MAG: TolC family protein [Bacteroidota bacterium]